MQNSREQGETRRPSSMKKSKQIEETNRKGKTKDIIKKSGNIKGIFHPKMSTIEDRHGKDLIEAEEITKDMERIQRRTVQKRS